MLLSGREVVWKRFCGCWTSSDVVLVVVWTETRGGKLVLMMAWSMARVAGSAYARLRGGAMVRVERKAINSVEQGASHLQRRPSVSSHHPCGEGKSSEKYKLFLFCRAKRRYLMLIYVSSDRNTPMM
jgi:hypothetical protein